MADSTASKRVFILGAGFSKAAGMPLAVGLTKALVNLEFNREDEEFHAWLKDFSRRINALEGKHDTGLNVEQLSEFARFDRELSLMRQQLCQVGRGYGDTPFDRAEKIDNWLEYMEEGLLDVLLDHQNRADWKRLARFFAELRKGDTIMTFNYDTIAESGISEAGMTWSHGFEEENAGGILVLKLHGSVDWWLVPRGCCFQGMKRLFAKVDTNARDHGHTPDGKENEYWTELHRASDLACVSRRYDEYTGLSNGPPARPGLAGLGSYKPLRDLVGSAIVWDRTFAALREAHELYVIGWSASPYDIMARFHFSSVLKMRDTPVSRAVVVDPNVNKGDNKKNFESVFGDIEVKAKKVEDVDWKALLSTS